jgi:ABC-type nitrate/sulfonate/bicarbonate transport system permease component
MRAAATPSRAVLGAASVLLGLAAWALASAALGDAEVLPSPHRVAVTMVQMLASGEIARASLESVRRMLVGYGIGAAAGIATGLALGSWRGAAFVFGPIFDFMKGLPPIALVPLFVMWLGIGEASKYAVIAYLVWVVVAIATAVGAREVPRIRLRAGATLGLSRIGVFRRVVVPSTVPYMVSGLRSALGFAFVALVSAELIAANSGIGQIIMDARFSLQTARMIVGLLVLGTLGALSQHVFDLLTSRLGVAYQGVNR